MLLVWKSLYEGTHSIWGNSFGFGGGYSQPPPALPGALVQLLACRGFTRAGAKPGLGERPRSGGQARAAAAMSVALAGAGRAQQGPGRPQAQEPPDGCTASRPSQTSANGDGNGCCQCGLLWIPVTAGCRVGWDDLPNKQTTSLFFFKSQTNKQKAKQINKKPTNERQK